MLTRDIDLQDAILDLLDNCVDGVQRSETARNLKRIRPYAGYWAKITLSADEFVIEDNCGGIPWALHDYAFRLGRLPGQDPRAGRRAIGTYGIGMKRAVFKMGEDCTIETHASDASYRVHFSADWMGNESDWGVDTVALRPAQARGTKIVVRTLRAGIRAQFASSTFLDKFREALSTYYAYILGKGFEVYLNGVGIPPRQMRLLFADSADTSFEAHRIEPFIYQAEQDGVSVFLAVGFTRGIPSAEEAEESRENYKDRYSSADAGWTVVCNDRTVLYADRSSMTGWGVAGVPLYHTQFIAISGIVLFTADDPARLPTTTTKRGLDPQSDLYLHVKDKMVEGMKLFTSYTNLWKEKALVESSRSEFAKTTTSSLSELQARLATVKMNPTRGILPGKQYVPTLPRPHAQASDVRISFKKPAREVRRVSKHLFGTPDRKPADVGEECFDLLLKESEG
jgi:hypothetical protein